MPNQTRQQPKLARALVTSMEHLWVTPVIPNANSTKCLHQLRQVKYDRATSHITLLTGFYVISP
jgi:hypothetical protein